MLSTLRFLFTIVVVFASLSATSANAREVQIATLFDGPLARQFITLSVVKKEIKAIVGDEFNIVFPTRAQVHGDWTVTGIQQQLNQLLRNKEVDIILTMGVVGSHLAAQTEALSKPVIAPVIVDVDLQQVPYVDNSSGKDNFVYLRFVKSVSDDLARFHDLVKFSHLAILVDELPMDAIPGLSVIANKAAKQFGFKISLVTGKDNLQLMTANIPGDADAVLVAPLLRVDDKDIRQLSDYLISKKLPSFSFLGQRELELGLMATLAGRASDEVVYARRIATNVYRILLGTPAKDLNVDFYASDRLSINMQTARAVGVSPRWQILEDAELINDSITSNKREISLSEAMALALEANIDLQATTIDSAISEDDIGVARSFLLPQLNANASYQTIDSDRANPLVSAENSTDAGINASQTIYSDGQWANYKISKYLRRSIDLDVQIILLDTLQAAATAYLNVLSAIAQERVQKSNVELDRENLELAKSRVRIGDSTRADVLRWQSQIARDRQSLLSAEANRKVAETELYRILNLAPGEAVATADSSVNKILKELNRSENRDLYDNPQAWEKFIEFQTTLAIDNAPEVKRFDFLLKAQNRQITADKRAYYVPEVSLTSSLSENLSRSGSGSDLRNTELNDDQWSIGVQATLPIFTSGQLSSQLNRSRNVRHQLSLQQISARQLVEVRMRSALFNAAASHSSIRLAENAAKAANENLSLVIDSYSEGALSITDVTDAQDAALEAQLQAAAARYQFLIDLVDVLRAESNFMLILQDDGVSIWQERVRATLQ